MENLPEKWTWARFADADTYSTKRASDFLQQNRKACRKALATLLAVILLTLLGLFAQSSGFATYSHHEAWAARDPHNRTLGFQKVFAVGLPSRTDKHDAMVVASSMSDIDLTWEDGVLFEDVDPKSIPEPFDWMLDQDWGPSAIGCWRAHLNVLSMIVDQKIATALVLEDDADWSINLKSQLEHFGKGLTTLQELNNDAVTPPSPRSGSPYGNHWDMLWLGSCHGGPTDGPQSMYFLHNDTTVPPPSRRRALWKNQHVPAEVLSNDTRIIYRTGYGLCTTGYAITLDGAQKVLTALSLRGGIGDQIDIMLSAMCANNPDAAMSLDCYSIYPLLIGSHRFAGSNSRDSDIKHLAEVEHDEFTKDIVYSTIQNTPRLLSGAEDAMSQWPEDTVPTIRLDEDYARHVWGEAREVDLRTIPEREIPGINVPGNFDPQTIGGGK